MILNNWRAEYECSGSGPPFDTCSSLYSIKLDFNHLDYEFNRIEGEVVHSIMHSLRDSSKTRNRTEFDSIFGHFSTLMINYSKLGLVQRAALMANEDLIPQVLDFEQTNGVEVHKGALFYDVGLAYFLMGDMDRCSYFVAMANEEDVETAKVEHSDMTRGEHNLFQGQRSKQLAKPTLDYVVEFLNEPLLDPNGQGGFERIFNRKLTLDDVDKWRTKLETTHHFEIFRVFQELEIFDCPPPWEFKRVLDNPFILLRLAKVLAHAAQWFESYLTKLQATIAGKTLSDKLTKDTGLFGNFHTLAGGPQQFGGTNPPTPTDTDKELQSLLKDIETTADRNQKRWRIVRIAYIVRNSMSHHIESKLQAYTDRSYLRKLLQHVLLANFVLCEQKNGQFP